MKFKDATKEDGQVCSVIKVTAHYQSNTLIPFAYSDFDSSRRLGCQESRFKRKQSKDDEIF